MHPCRRRPTAALSVLCAALLSSAGPASASISPWRGDGTGRYLFGVYQVPPLPNFVRRDRGAGTVPSRTAEDMDTDLLMFTGDDCAHCDEMEPYLQFFERKLHKNIARLNVWRSNKFYRLFKDTDSGCGGLPYFYNRKSKKSICGATTPENLILFMTDRSADLFEYDPADMDLQRFLSAEDMKDRKLLELVAASDVARKTLMAMEKDAQRAAQSNDSEDGPAFLQKMKDTISRGRDSIMSTLEEEDGAE